MEFGMVALLRAAWVAATLPILVASVPVRPIGFFHKNLAVFAARGKTMQSSTKGSLREQRGADEYKVPNGDWFEHVSCPHYLFEIVIYAGMLIASGAFDLTVWLLFFFVASNLIFAAAQTHRWYHQKFESYPPSRRAIIPWIY